MSLLIKNNLQRLVWIAVAALVSACQTAPQKDLPGSAPVDSREIRVVTSGGFAVAYNVLAPQFEKERCAKTCGLFLFCRGCRHDCGDGA